MFQPAIDMMPDAVALLPDTFVLVDDIAEGIDVLLVGIEQAKELQGSQYLIGVVVVGILRQILIV